MNSYYMGKNNWSNTLFESFEKSDIIKKIYKTSRDAENVNIDFHNGYRCELTSVEFIEFCKNIIIAFYSWQEIEKAIIELNEPKSNLTDKVLN